ncbi:MAG: START-like domain-containing protein [Bacteroidota bacterium]|nr:START-like domain-containing protein [Bacteroidota bacterium]MDP4226438.1 START-like domain-containing protein [Bacteroidota bacterium]MDP4275689.1 START-like domain-containing protein [Bacteroidota bacterium]
MKKKIELEYSLNSSPKILFNHLSTPGGLSEWFAEDVNQDGKIFTFVWEGTKHKAEMILFKDLHYIRFHWLDDTDKKTYFEFKINTDEITNDISIVITDFAEDDEKNDLIELWNEQVSQLKQVLGL